MYTYIHVYIFTYVYIYIYICKIHITGNMGARALVPPSGRYPGAGGYCFDFGGLFADKKRSRGVLQAMGSTKQV